MQNLIKQAQWSVTPRRWQSEAFNCVQEFYNNGEDHGVIIAIMGAGKSILISEVAASIRAESNEVIAIVTPTEMLVGDIFKTVNQRAPGLVGKFYGKRKNIRPITVVCLRSIDTFASAIKRSKRKIKFLILDEAHRTQAEQALTGIDNCEPHRVLGLTATPFRSDQWQSLTLFEHVLYRYGVVEARADKVVCPWKIVNTQTSLDLNESCFEFIKAQSGPGLANARDTKDAEAFASYLKENGLRAEAVHYRTKNVAQVMTQLEQGELDVVVYVNMLSEGANYPFLRYLCLRRQVDARVRFVQEVGRVLRSHPNKEYAIYFDPHDLFDVFQLSYEEALGEPPEKPLCEMPEVMQPEEIQRCMDEERDPAVIIKWTENLVRTLSCAADVAGILGKRIKVTVEKKLGPVTSTQIILINRSYGLAKEFIPEKWRVLVEKIVSEVKQLRFGWAADLLAVLDGVKANKRWPPCDTQGRILGNSDLPCKVDEHGQKIIQFALMEEKK